MKNLHRICNSLCSPSEFDKWNLRLYPTTGNKLHLTVLPLSASYLFFSFMTILRSYFKWSSFPGHSLKGYSLGNYKTYYKAFNSMTLSDHVTYHCELKTNVVHVQYFKHRIL